MQRQISHWRKELSIITETGTGSDNGKLHRKKEEYLLKMKSDKCRRICTFDRDNEAGSVSKSPKNQKI